MVGAKCFINTFSSLTLLSRGPLVLLISVYAVIHI